LIHELRELAGTEELLNRSHNRPDVNQGLRRNNIDILDGHSLLDNALHPRQTNPELVLKQLSNPAHPAVAKVVNVICISYPPEQAKNITNARNYVLSGYSLHIHGRLPVTHNPNAIILII